MVHADEPDGAVLGVDAVAAVGKPRWGVVAVGDTTVAVLKTARSPVDRGVPTIGGTYGVVDNRESGVLRNAADDKRARGGVLDRDEHAPEIGIVLAVLGGIGAGAPFVVPNSGIERLLYKAGRGDLAVFVAPAEELEDVARAVVVGVVRLTAQPELVAADARPVVGDHRDRRADGHDALDAVVVLAVAGILVPLDEATHQHRGEEDIVGAEGIVDAADGVDADVVKTHGVVAHVVEGDRLADAGADLHRAEPFRTVGERELEVALALTLQLRGHAGERVAAVRGDVLVEVAGDEGEVVAVPGVGGDVVLEVLLLGEPGVVVVGQPEGLVPVGGTGVKLPPRAHFKVVGLHLHVVDAVGAGGDAEPAVGAMGVGPVVEVLVLGAGSGPGEVAVGDLELDVAGGAVDTGRDPLHVGGKVAHPELAVGRQDDRLGGVGAEVDGVLGEHGGAGELAIDANEVEGNGDRDAGRNLVGRDLDERAPHIVLDRIHLVDAAQFAFDDDAHTLEIALALAEADEPVDAGGGQKLVAALHFRRGDVVGDGGLALDIGNAVVEAGVVDVLVVGRVHREVVPELDIAGGGGKDERIDRAEAVARIERNGAPEGVAVVAGVGGVELDNLRGRLGALAQIAPAVVEIRRDNELVGVGGSGAGIDVIVGRGAAEDVDVGLGGEGSREGNLLAEHLLAAAVGIVEAERLQVGRHHGVGDEDVVEQDERVTVEGRGRDRHGGGTADAEAGGDAEVERHGHAVEVGGGAAMGDGEVDAGSGDLLADEVGSVVALIRDKRDTAPDGVGVVVVVGGDNLDAADIVGLDGHTGDVLVGRREERGRIAGDIGADLNADAVVVADVVVPAVDGVEVDGANAVGKAGGVDRGSVLGVFSADVAHHNLAGGRCGCTLHFEVIDAVR